MQCYVAKVHYPSRNSLLGCFFRESLAIWTQDSAVPVWRIKHLVDESLMHVFLGEYVPLSGASSRVGDTEKLSLHGLLPCLFSEAYVPRKYEALQ